MAPRKQLRTSQACDFCSRRSIRCRTSDEDTARCQNCADFDVPCTYNRPMQKRGQKKKNIVGNASGHQVGQSAHGLDREIEDGGEGIDESDQITLARAWKAFAEASEKAIIELMEDYFNIIYPIFPWFHRRTIFERIAKKEHLTDRGCFASIMAACALTATRLRDGAVSTLHNPAKPAPEPFFAAAKDAIPKDLSHKRCRGIDYLRACGLLALASIQDGQVQQMHYYMGLYHTLSALEGLFDEKNWPKVGTSKVELEERRCLFWSIYTFEVFSSIVWGGIIRIRESQSQVRYPCAIEDDPVDPEHPSPKNHWLIGWNFTTDLYRILEIAIDNYRVTKPAIKPDLAVRSLRPGNHMILSQIQTIFSQIPDEFKNIPQDTSPTNIYAFQVTNIQATLALVHVVVFASEKDPNVERRCKVAGELLEQFTRMPVAFSKTMGSPFLHHIAGIGCMLGQAIEKPVSEQTYLRVRDLLLSMASLLEGLEIGVRSPQQASLRVRSRIQRIDEYVAGTRTSQGELPSQQSLIDQSSPSSQDATSQASTHDSSGSIQPGVSNRRRSNIQHQVQSQAQVQAHEISSQQNDVNGDMQATVDMMLDFPQELFGDWPWSAQQPDAMLEPPLMGMEFRLFQ